jgi:hypothetical protein
MLYLNTIKFQDMLEYVFDKEVIEITNLSVKIEKFGAGFKNKKEFPADNIKGVTTFFSFGKVNAPIRRSPFVNSNMPAFSIWHRRGLKRFHSFGRAIEPADAQSILEIMSSRFPQYRG